MRPVLFSWRGRVIWSYPAMLYLGLVAGIIAGNMAAHAAGVDPLRVYIATLLLVIVALAGARLQFVIINWQLYRGSGRRVWNSRDRGVSMYGGLPLALAASIPLLYALRLNFGAFWDVAIFTILVGMIFTRVGCVLNGCCAGRPTETWFSLYLPNLRGVWQNRFPTQFLEAICATVLLILALAIRQRVPFPGALFLLVAGGYAAARFLMEFMRERNPGASGLSWNHRISLVTLISSVSVLAILWRK